MIFGAFQLVLYIYGKFISFCKLPSVLHCSLVFRFVLDTWRSSSCIEPLCRIPLFERIEVPRQMPGQSLLLFHHYKLDCGEDSHTCLFGKKWSRWVKHQRHQVWPSGSLKWWCQVTGTLPSGVILGVLVAPYPHRCLVSSIFFFFS